MPESLKLTDEELRLTEGMPGAVKAGFLLAMRKEPLQEAFDRIPDCP